MGAGTEPGIKSSVSGGVAGAEGVISAPTAINFGDKKIRGFLFDNVFHSKKDGDIHFGMHLPEQAKGNAPYALFVTLPGYEGLYFQGVGANIRAEDYGIEAQKYNENMIVIAPQLNDWDQTSARQTVALTQYFLEHYNIDPEKVYLNGYSGGGETGSLVMEIAPELFSAFLHCSSQWDGDLEALVNTMTPVYMVTGKDDSYYGSASVRQTAEKLRTLYKKKGFHEDQINKLVVLDLKDQTYFEQRGISDQHGGGVTFSHDGKVMGWLFGEHAVNGF
ncbi:MAG: prolyl oligopeptidase family serine peptidase [Eubacteriaceae bacterium]|nr:prolyl oligopeptidase family serine peptidase [Eubacteriaceae bacterium]